MTFDQLRYFLETARHQHLGKASLALHISPSAVSAAIASLEEEYGCELFVREGKRIYLTDQGKYLKSRSEMLFDQIGSMELGLRAQKTEFIGTYKIAASHYLATHVLGKLWPKMQKKYPHLFIELGSMPTHRILAEVLTGDIDAGLCFSPLPHPELTGTEIYKGQMLLAARKSHPIFKQPQAQQLKSLSDYPALVHKPVVGIDLCEDHPMFAKFGLKPKVSCFWDSDDVAIEILKASDTWSMLPEFVIQQQRNILRALTPPPGWSAPITINFMVKSHRQESPVVQLLVQELRSLEVSNFKL